MAKTLDEVKAERLELERRMKQLDAEIQKLQAPQVQDTIDVQRITAFAKEVVQSIEEDSYMKDRDHWAFETIMEAVYGKNYWKWHNKHDNLR